ncbi:MAG: hypothetical protein ACREU8_12235 [Gammaproteobacteria bacterium]
MAKLTEIDYEPRRFDGAQSPVGAHGAIAGGSEFPQADRKALGNIGIADRLLSERVPARPASQKHAGTPVAL